MTRSITNPLFMHVEVAPDQPALVALAVDSLGKERLSINPLRPPAKAEKTYELRRVGNAFEYRPSGASPAAPPAWVFEFSARQMHLRLHFAGGNPPPPLMLNFNSYFYHATLLGLINVLAEALNSQNPTGARQKCGAYAARGITGTRLAAC